MPATTSKTKRLVTLLTATGVIMAIVIMIIKTPAKPDYGLTNITLKPSVFDVVYGTDTAPVKIYAFMSYQCAFCRKFYSETFPLLKTTYIEKGELQLIVKYIDLTRDAQMEHALKTLVCLNQFGNPEPMHQLLLADPSVVYTNEFLAVTDEFIEKDIQVAQCLVNGDAQNYLNANYAQFKLLQLTGTPTFVVQNRIYKGFKTFEQFKTILNGK